MDSAIVKVWVDDTAVYIETAERKVFCRLFADFPLLRNATHSQRADFQKGKLGIRWACIDEDLSYQGFFNYPLPSPSQKPFAPRSGKPQRGQRFL
jgi:hypothetical protein